MARYTGSKNKLSRRSGIDLGLKTNPAKAARRLNIPPGQHGRRGTRKVSEYGVQLREKQKMKWVYGVLEKQFHRYYLEATKKPGETGKEMLRQLESRLDNVVYRLGFAPTRAAARQMVSHGNVSVNGAKLDRPSFQVKPEMTITISAKAAKIPAVASLLEEKNVNMPKWLEKQALTGKMKTMPDRDDVDIEINENLVVEYYSR
jgi:small subunit ribosomal protein S4